MLERILEPEVMDSVDDAVDYDAMDHSDVNRVFVADYLTARRRFDSIFGRDSTILDVGTGTALIPIEYCQQGGSGTIVGIDMAEEMLKLGRQRVTERGLSERIRLKYADAKKLGFEDGLFDGVMSNSIVHHIPKPADVFGEMLRVLRPGGMLFVRDLMRPADQHTLDQLVETYAENEADHARQLFRDSLHAALTVDEVQEILHSFGYPKEWVSQTSDRHWTVSGVQP
ncbi:class I SAM-dependent methyltransferase [Thalassoroseus pseudoceratinae]|uniref:class I SAM-dependent methyltransferase n=1 Tax=Thalassoroseus pseudoceratinae TaxID=2713176 RepID=UPI00141DA5DA|nr:class I SAM-dependent methyltransferase [Thalassoroseus pseudoceratinae]